MYTARGKPPQDLAVKLLHCKVKGCFDSIWLPQFPTSSTSLYTVESHCLLYIPNYQITRTLVKLMSWVNGLLIPHSSIHFGTFFHIQMHWTRNHMSIVDLRDPRSRNQNKSFSIFIMYKLFLGFKINTPYFTQVIYYVQGSSELWFILPKQYYVIWKNSAVICATSMFAPYNVSQSHQLSY